MVPPYVFLASAICLSLLSLTTFISNLLLLLAICRKDSGRYFKFTAPRTVFMVALSLADLLTALTTENTCRCWTVDINYSNQLLLSGHLSFILVSIYCHKTSTRFQENCYEKKCSYSHFTEFVISSVLHQRKVHYRN